MTPMFRTAPVCVGLFLAGCTGAEEKPSPVPKPVVETPAGPSPEVIARGKYLVDNVSACIECHTPRNPDGTLDMTRYLGGSDCFLDIDRGNPDVGCVSPRNLTNDPTGLKNRSDAEIKAMFTEGKRPDGSSLHSFMPYWVYANMTPQDADSIVAYLRTVPGIDHTTPPVQAPFDVPIPPAPPLDPEKDIPKPMTPSPEAERGRYLTSMAGVCIECHTQHNPPGPGPALVPGVAYAGGFAIPASWMNLPSPPLPETITTANLTQHETGLKGWTAEDIKHVVIDARDREGKGVCPPMPAGPMFAYGGITEADMADIAAYILALPPIANERPNCIAPEAPEHPQDVAGPPG